MHVITGRSPLPDSDRSCQVQNEEGLIEKAKQKDLAALSRLYEANFTRIYRYVYSRVTDKTEAEDLTQQVFLKVIQSIESYNCRGLPFSSWLFRIAHNQLIDYVRKKARGPQLGEDLSSVEFKGPNPEEKAEETVMMEMVHAGMKHLTALQQEVLSLRFAGGLSIIETARVMGKNEGAIKALQHSALDSLRRVLGVSTSHE